MELFVVLRRSAWDSEDELDDAAAVSVQVADEDMDNRVRWIRSYVLAEEDGTFGTVCIYEAEDEDALLEHSQRAELPADEILPVARTVVIRDDP